jgi:hypothetical protein
MTGAFDFAWHFAAIWLLLNALWWAAWLTLRR